MDRILITGITGFIGSHLAEFLLAKGHRIWGTKDWRSPQDNVDGISDKIQLINANMRDQVSLRLALEESRPTVIFHLAADAYVPASYTHPTSTMETNAIGTICLLEAVRQTGLKSTIIIASSSDVYGKVKKEDIPITEDCPFRPISPYGTSKLAQDMIGYQYSAAYAMRIIRARMFIHTGPRSNPTTSLSSFAKQIAEIESGKKKATLSVGNLDSLRTFGDVRDLCQALWLLAKKGRTGEAYNIGSTEPLKVGDALDMLIGMSTAKDLIKVKVDKRRLRPTDVVLQIPNTDKMRKETGWRPKIPIETTLKDLLDYWRERVSR